MVKFPKGYSIMNDNIKVSDLKRVYKEIAEECGFETTLKIHKLFAGQNVSFPKRIYTYSYIYDHIRRNYNGENIDELADKFCLTPRRIRQILKQK